MESIVEEVAEAWERARRLIDSTLADVISLLPEAYAVDVARYIVEGGKRLRGFLVLAVAEATGGTWEEALPAAAAVEMVHASSLALDDIIDGDRFRRGKPAAWVKFGVRKTVMVSNLLIPYAQRLVAEKYGEEALKLTVNAWLDVSRGEVMDAFIEPNKVDYMTLVRLKTGALFRLAAELGVAASRAWGKLRVAAEYGEYVGLAYQVADDIVDLRRGSPGASGEILSRSFGGVCGAMKLLRELVTRASELGRRIGGMLQVLPKFMVDAMLREAGLKLE